MNIIDAHGMFSARPDGGAAVLPEEINLSAAPGFDGAPALATAAVVLSGWLDDCGTNAELDEAAAHFRSLLSGGIVSPEQWAQEAAAVVEAVCRWGDRLAEGAARN